MKVLILAGGLGTRISEETHSIPKPMVKIGKDPILIHIMRHFAGFDHKEFYIALGYKGYVIKEYFKNYKLHNSDVSIDFKTNNFSFSNTSELDWLIHLVETGEETLTGGRVKILENSLQETFMLTYGDGIADVNLTELVSFHKSHGKLATVTSVVPPGRYGILEIDSSKNVIGFAEKPPEFGSQINGGFFIFEPEIFGLLSGNETLEEGLLPKLASLGELVAFRHNGFWQSMDTLRDKRYLDSLFKEGRLPGQSSN